MSQDQSVALPFRAHTIFGVCEAIGQDFGFNPAFLRVPLAGLVIYNIWLALGLYAGLGLVVLTSRLLFPAKSAVKPAVAPVVPLPANSQADERVAA